jgi:predicted hydrolase (HD superfamily)
MTREDAINILDDLKNSQNMKNHGFAVGFAMAALYDFFKSNGQTPELGKEDWEITGILHDADYEITGKSLDLHTDETVKKLKAQNADQLIISAIRGHCDKEPRQSLMAKSVYAADELAGLIVACALVQPGKKLQSVSVESVMRKFKDSSFAKGANRNQIKTCESQLGTPLEEFVKITLDALQKHSKELGL